MQKQYRVSLHILSKIRLVFHSRNWKAELFFTWSKLAINSMVTPPLKERDLRCESNKQWLGAALRKPHKDRSWKQPQAVNNGEG